MFEVIFYETEDGTSPAEEFIDTLSNALQAKIFRMLTLLKREGNRLREPYSKPLQDGIFELRTQLGTDSVRILYFFFIGNRAILTNGFTKKTQKTPISEIALAKKYRKDYIDKQGAV